MKGFGRVCEALDGFGPLDGFVMLWEDLGSIWVSHGLDFGLIWMSFCNGFERSWVLSGF